MATQGVDTLGNPVVEKDKYGPGSSTVTNSMGQETVYHDPTLPRRKASLATFMKTQNGAIDPDAMEQSLNLHNLKPYYDEEEFNVAADEIGLEGEDREAYKEFLSKYPEYYERKVANGIYANASVGRRYNISEEAAAPDGMSFLHGNMKFTTRDKLAEARGFFFDKDGFPVPISDRASNKYSYLKIQDTESGPSLQEVAENELVNSQDMYTIFGARGLESNYFGSMGRGALNATLGFGNYGLGFVQSIGYKASRLWNNTDDLVAKYKELGYSDELAEKYADKEFEKNNWWAQAANNSFNRGSYWSHKNIDESTSMFSDDFDYNSLVFGITDAAVQLIPTIVSGGLGSVIAGGGKAGINAIGKKFLKNKTDDLITSNWAKSGSVFTSQVQGSATVGGLMIQELQNKGMSMNDSFWAGTLAAGITLGSENVFQWNLTNQMGHNITKKIFQSVSPDDIRRVARQEIDDSLKAFGKNSLKDLSDDQKKEVSSNVVSKVLGFRGQKIGQTILNRFKDKKFSQVAIGSFGAAFEEALEEGIEGVGHMVQAPFLNSMLYSNARVVVNGDKDVKFREEIIEGNPTGRYYVTDSKGNEKLIDSETYDSHMSSVSIANEVLDGVHDIDEGFHAEEMAYAFMGTLLSMGMLRYSGAIQTNDDRINTASQLAYVLEEDTKKAEKFESGWNDFYGSLSEQEKVLADRLKEDIELFRGVINKYGLKDDRTKAILGNNSRLMRELSKEYVYLDKLLALQEKSKEEGFDWSSKESNPSTKFKSDEELEKAIAGVQTKISEYIDVKENLVNGKGENVPAKTSLRYSRLHNLYHSYDEALEKHATVLAEREAFKESREVKPGETESAYEKRYNSALAEIKKKLQKTGALFHEEASNAILGLQSVDPNIANNFYNQLNDLLNKAYEAEVNRIERGVQKEYDSTNEDKFKNQLDNLESEIKGGNYSKLESVNDKAFTGLKTLVSSLSNIRSDALNTEVNERIDSLLQRARSLFDQATDILSKGDNGVYASMTSAYEAEVTENDFQSLSGFDVEAEKKKIDREALKMQAFKNFIEENLIDQEGNNFRNKMIQFRNYVKNNQELNQIEAAAILDLLHHKDHSPIDYLAAMDAFLNGYDFNESLENHKDKKFHEHSSLSLPNYNNELRFNSDQRDELKKYIEETREVLGQVMALAEDSAGSRELQSINGNFQSVFATLEFINDIIDHGKISNKRVKQAKKAIDKHLNKYREENEINESADIGDVLYRAYQDIGMDPEKLGERIEFLKTQVWPIEKELIEIIDALSGQLTPIMDDIKAKIAEASPSIDVNAMTRGLFKYDDIIINYSKTTLEGTLSPKAVKESLRKFHSNENPLKNSLSTDPINNVLSYYLQFLNRVNSYGVKNGNNEAPRYKDMVSAIKQSTLSNMNQLEKYLGENDSNVVFEDQYLAMLSTLFASSHEQMQSALHLLGFLTDVTNNSGLGPSKKNPKFQQLSFPNAINVLGYAGGGKTTKIVGEAFKAYRQLLGKEFSNKKFKYIGPSDQLIDDFKESVDGIFDDNQITFDNFTQLGKIDYSETDILILDEAAALDKGQVNLLAEKMKHGKIVFISDDAQIMTSKYVNEESFLSSLTERTKPVSIIYRSGMSMHVDFVNNIRENIGKDGFELKYTFTYHKKNNDNLDREGGEYTEDIDSLISSFNATAKHMSKKLGRGVTPEDMILIVLDDKAYDKLHMAVPEKFRHLIKTAAVSDSSNRMISGIKSRKVFVAIDFKDNQQFTETALSNADALRRNIERYVKPRIALTAASRVTEYLMMVSDGSVEPNKYSNEVPKSIPKNVRDTESQIEENYQKNQINSAYFDAVLGDHQFTPAEEETAEPEKADSDTTNVRAADNRRTAPMYGEDEVSKLLNQVDALGFNSITTNSEVAQIKSHVTSWEYINELVDEKLDDSLEQQRQRIRARMIKFAMMENLSRTISYPVTEETNKRLKDEFISTEFDKAVKEWVNFLNANHKKFGKKKLKGDAIDAEIRLVKNMLKSQSIPASISDNIQSFNNQSTLLVAPALSHNKFGGVPFALDFTGFYNDSEGNSIPIVNIHEITMQPNLTDYDKAKVAGYVALLQAKGIKVNTITIHQHRAQADTPNYNYQTQQGLTFDVPIEDIQEEITKASNQIGSDISAEEAQVGINELYQKPRYFPNIAGTDFKPGNIITYKGNREIIDAVSTYYDCKDWVYNVHLKNSDEIVTITDIDDLNTKISEFNPDEKDGLFKENMIRSIHNESGSQIVRTSYIPIVPTQYYDNGKIYSPKSEIIKHRLEIQSYFSNNRRFRFDLEFHENYDVTGRVENAEGDFEISNQPYTLKKAVAIKLTDSHIKKYLTDKEVKINGKVLDPKSSDDIATFKDMKLDILAFMNPIDIDFKSKTPEGKMQSNTLFDNAEKTKIYQGLVDDLVEAVQREGSLPNRDQLSFFVDSELDAIFTDSFLNDEYRNDLIEFNKQKIIDLMILEVNSKVKIPTLKSKASADGTMSDTFRKGWNDFSSIREKLVEEGHNVGELKFRGMSQKGMNKGKRIHIAKVQGPKGSAEIYVRGATLTEEMASKIRSVAADLRKSMVAESSNIADIELQEERLSREKLLYDKLGNSLPMQFLRSNLHAIIENEEIIPGLSVHLRLKDVKGKKIVVGRGGLISEIDNIIAAVNYLIEDSMNGSRKTAKKQLFYPVMEDGEFTVTRSFDVSMPHSLFSTSIDYEGYEMVDETPTVPVEEAPIQSDQADQEVEEAESLEDEEFQDEERNPFVIDDTELEGESLDATGDPETELESTPEEASQEINRILGAGVKTQFSPKIEKNDITGLMDRGELRYADEETDESCLEHGGIIGELSKGGQWKLVKEYKGATHKEGGIPINLLGRKLQVSSGELLIANDKGDRVIIPTIYAVEVKDMIENNCNRCLDKFVSQLPQIIK